MTAYPRELAHTLRLPGGAHIHTRPIRGEDEQTLVGLFGKIRLDELLFAQRKRAASRDNARPYSPTTIACWR